MYDEHVDCDGWLAGCLRWQNTNITNERVVRMCVRGCMAWQGITFEKDCPRDCYTDQFSLRQSHGDPSVTLPPLRTHSFRIVDRLLCTDLPCVCGSVRLSLPLSLSLSSSARFDTRLAQHLNTVSSVFNAFCSLSNG